MTDKISSEDFIKAFGKGSMPNYHEMRDGQKFYENGYTKGYQKGYQEGHIDGVLQGEKLYARPQGEWITKGYEPYGRCNICNEICEINNFCGNCGAKMEAKKNEIR